MGHMVIRDTEDTVMEDTVMEVTVAVAVDLRSNLLKSIFYLLIKTVFIISINETGEVQKLLNYFHTKYCRGKGRLEKRLHCLNGRPNPSSNPLAFDLGH